MKETDMNYYKVAIIAINALNVLACDNPLEPGSRFVPLRRPCDDPRSNFEKIRTLRPGGRKAKRPAKPQPPETVPSGTEERLAAALARLRASGQVL